MIINVSFIFVIILFLKHVLRVSLWWLRNRAKVIEVPKDMFPKGVSGLLSLLNPPLFVGKIPWFFCWLDMGSG